MGNLSALDGVLRRFMEDEGPAGIALRVYREGKPLYEADLGYADAEAGTPVNGATLFRLASMTKIIACTAYLQLYEKGAFLLTDPVGDYLPTFKNTTVYREDGKGGFTITPAARPIEIGDLFCMSSGVTAGWGEGRTNKDIRATAEKLDKKGKYTVSEYVAALGKIPMAFDPGAHWYYGISLDVLAGVLEKLTGMTFGEYLKKNIFDPLGMEDTFFRVPEEKAGRLAKCYSYKKGERVASPMGFPGNGSYESASGGLTSTIEDYAKFANCLTLGEYKGVRLLGDHTIRLMAKNRLEPQPLKEFPNAYHAGYGYGLGVRTLMDPAVGGNNGSVGEFGWTGAFGTWVLMDPAEKLTIVYMHQLMPNREAFIHPRVRNIIYGAL